MHPNLRLALDFAPIAVFFVAYHLGGLPAATVALIVVTAGSLGFIYAVEKKIAMVPLVSGILVTVLGGLTLYLNDDVFIKMKPTFVNLLSAGILLIGLYGFKKPLIKYVLGSVIPMTEKGWRALSARWGFFFLFLAALNEVIWRHFSTDTWVNFKVFGMLTLTMVFTGLQLPLINREMVEEPPGQDSGR